MCLSAVLRLYCSLIYVIRSSTQRCGTIRFRQKQLIPPVHAWQEQATDVERTVQYLSLRGVSSRRIQALRRMKPS